MPGYRPIGADQVGGPESEARAAQALVRDGNVVDAAILLEEAIRTCLQSDASIPSWLCGRLACIYRTLGRYDDEVDLICRYRDSQVSEETRSRYDARLCKAQALAEKHRRTDSGALASIRLLKKSRRSTARPVERDATGS